MDTDILARCTHGFLVEQRRKLWRPMIHVIKTCAAIRPDETVCVPLSSRADTVLMALMLSQLHDHSDFPFRLLFFWLQSNMGSNCQSPHLTKREVGDELDHTFAQAPLIFSRG